MTNEKKATIPDVRLGEGIKSAEIQISDIVPERSHIIGHPSVIDKINIRRPAFLFYDTGLALDRPIFRIEKVVFI